VNYGVEAITGSNLASNLRLLPNNPANTYAITGGAKGVFTVLKNGDKAQFAFDGADPLAVPKRLGVTRIEALGINSAQSAPQRTGPVWDVFTNVAGYEPQAPGTGVQSGSYPVQQQTVWGRRYPVGGHETPLDLSKRNLLQLTGPDGQEAAVDLIAYNGDYDCGVRVHNLAFYGKTASQVRNYTGWWETLTSFGAEGSPDANGNLRKGATFAKLVLFDFITNEATGAAIPPEQFKADYTTLVERALSLYSRPSVLLLIPPPRWSSNTSINLAPEQYQPYVNAVYEIAEEHDNIAILDLWRFWGGGSPQSYPDGPMVVQ
jgi:hypothetical protein